MWADPGCRQENTYWWLSPRNPIRERAHFSGRRVPVWRVGVGGARSAMSPGAALRLIGPVVQSRVGEASEADRGDDLSDRSARWPMRL